MQTDINVISVAGKKRLKVGLIVNPWAGIGGPVGLKGSDGDSIRAEALQRGAEAKAEKRVEVFLTQLVNEKARFEFLTFPLSMGETALNNCGFEFELLQSQKKSQWEKIVKSVYCSAEDTRQAALEMARQGVDIIVFVGGDGTARDVAEALKDFPEQLCLGIPAGVKIHSGVFAISPFAAAEVLLQMLANNFISLERAEVRDIDEEQLRAGLINSKYYSELWMPRVEGLVQCSKQGSVSGLSESDAQAELLVYDEIAAYLLEIFNENDLLIIGAGKTCYAFKQRLGIEATLLGVDVVRDGKLLLKDASEQEIKTLLASEQQQDAVPAIVVSVIGGQGFVFGRGNQQISADVIRQVLGSDVRKERVTILASRQKIARLESACLFVDTGDRELDQRLAGLWRVLIDYDQHLACRVQA